MMFSVSPVYGAHNASAEERATMCDLRIMVADDNACLHRDILTGDSSDAVRVPAVYLAEGIATDWWSIFGRRDRRHSLRPYRTGFILPDLSFGCDGSTFEASAEPMYCENPGLLFGVGGIETMPRHEAEAELARFIETVADMLRGNGLEHSELILQWDRVSASRIDPDESAFCEAAGALGVDPYAIDEADAQYIEHAGRMFEADALGEFLAGVSENDRALRNRILESAFNIRQTNGNNSALPVLRSAAVEVSNRLDPRTHGEPAWATGYRNAQAFRNVIDLRECAPVSVNKIAATLGNGAFQYENDLVGILALVSREDDIHIRLRETAYAVSSRNFNFARAIGDAVCFPDGSHSVINRLQQAERQAMSRAFAAEFLAPAEQVFGMADDGLATDQIAEAFRVSEFVIERQVENRDRIAQVCA